MRIYVYNTGYTSQAFTVEDDQILNKQSDTLSAAVHMVGVWWAWIGDSRHVYTVITEILANASAKCKMVWKL